MEKIIVDIALMAAGIVVAFMTIGATDPRVSVESRRGEFDEGEGDW